MAELERGQEEKIREYLGDSIPQAGPPADKTEDTEMHRQYRALVGESGG